MSDDDAKHLFARASVIAQNAQRRLGEDATPIVMLVAAAAIAKQLGLTVEQFVSGARIAFDAVRVESVSTVES